MLSRGLSGLPGNFLAVPGTFWPSRGIFSPSRELSGRPGAFLAVPGHIFPFPGTFWQSRGLSGLPGHILVVPGHFLVVPVSIPEIAYQVSFSDVKHFQENPSDFKENNPN
jgi:hypothetical protein